MTKQKKIAALFLAAAVLLFSCFAALAETVPEGFSSMEEYLDYLLNGGTQTAEKPPLHQMQLAGENERFRLYFYEQGVDLFLEEKSTGKVYGTAVDDSYYAVEELPESAYSRLLTLEYSEDGKTTAEAELVNATENQFAVSAAVDSGAVTLHVGFMDEKLSFDVVVSLEENGLCVRIPQSSIAESDGLRLVSIQLCPFFGAAKPGEDGYVLYPDGSGALMNVATYKKEQPEFYSYPIYCADQADFSALEEAEYQDLKSCMLPCYGIKHTVGGIFSEIEQGAENAALDLSVDTFYQAAFRLNYRVASAVKYEFASKSSGEIDTIGEELFAGDRTVHYYVLPGQQNTYSDMAVLYRQVLTDRQVLQKQDTPLTLSLELFMGIVKSGILGDSLQKLTTYAGAQEIVEDLKNSGVDRVDLLLQGWADGGYTALPTGTGAASALGGQGALDKLGAAVAGSGGHMYLGCNILQGNRDTGSFNAQSDALRNGIDVVITDKTEKLFFLNPVRTLEAYARKLSAAQKNSGYCYLDMGRILLSSLGETNATTRAQIIERERAVLEGQENVAVSGGGLYTFSFADRLYAIPETDSGYYQCDAAVPFYSMVVHGYKSYSGTAANLSHDYRYQKLQFIETGSLPHFVVTENSPNLLQGTDYDGIYSSEYADWKEIILATYTDIAQRLGDHWSETIDRHERLSDSLVRITYGSGTAVLLNYGDSEVVQDGVTVPAMDFTVVKGQ